jgi:hypothetical protein
VIGPDIGLALGLSSVLRYEASVGFKIMGSLACKLLGLNYRLSEALSTVGFGGYRLQVAGVGGFVGGEFRVL